MIYVLEVNILRILRLLMKKRHKLLLFLLLAWCMINLDEGHIGLIFLAPAELIDELFHLDGPDLPYLTLLQKVVIVFVIIMLVVLVVYHTW